MSLQLQKALSDEAYALQISDIVSQDNTNKILEVNGMYRAADNALKGQLHFQADQNQLLPFTFGITLPKFQSNAQGTYNYNFTDAKGAAQLECDLMIRNLSTVQQELQLLDDLNLKSVSDFTFAPKHISINNLNTTINDKNSNALFVLNLNQPFEIKNNKVNLQGDLVTCSINHLPLFQLLSAFSNMQLEGSPISAVYKLKAISPTELVIVNEQPLTFDAVSLTNQDQQILEKLAGSLASTATLKMDEVVQLEGKPHSDK